MRQMVAVAGVRLNAEVVLPQRETGMPVVLLHGFTGSAAGWGNRLTFLADAGHRAVALDLLGHGGSDAPEDPVRYAIERCRDDIVAACRALGIREREAALLGYSMGGRIALFTAFSRYFRAALLESASPGLRTADERSARRASDDALADRIEREGVSAFVEYWEHLPLFATQTPDQRAALRPGRLANRARGLANSLRGVGTGAQPSLWDDLPSLDLPVLLLAGALDEKYAAIARQMAAVLPHARLTIVPGAGHAIHVERPEAFDAAVAEFLDA
jgi:2-succinyl-6-hydroxy-2,4-cyclohexadiene-1-carboxylate synthase